MWYFTWILGLAFACTFGVLNAMWLEVQEQRDADRSVAAKSREQR